MEPTPETLAHRLVRIETKIDAILLASVDHETRIRKVEGRVTALFGGGTILAGFVAFIAAFQGFFDFAPKGH